MDTEIQRLADQSRFMLEVWLNVQLTTWQDSMGLTEGHSLDLVTTTEKYRAMGVIK